MVKHPIKVGDIISVRIDGLSQEGSGVGDFQGRKVFVPQTIVTEEVTAKVHKVTSAKIFTQIDSIVGASPDRVTPSCEVFGVCGVGIAVLIVRRRLIRTVRCVEREV